MIITINHDQPCPKGGGGQGLETGRRNQNSTTHQVCVGRLFFLPCDTAAPDIVHMPSLKKTNKSNLNNEPNAGGETETRGVTHWADVWNDHFTAGCCKCGFISWWDTRQLPHLNHIYEENPPLGEAGEGV